MLKQVQLLGPVLKQRLFAISNIAKVDTGYDYVALLPNSI